MKIKEIEISMEGEGKKRMVVRKEGKGVVKDGEIKKVGDVEIMKKEKVI